MIFWLSSSQPGQSGGPLLLSGDPCAMELPKSSQSVGRERERARGGQKEQESEKERQRQRGVMVRTRWQPPHQQLSSSSALDIQLLFGCLLSTPHARYRYPAPPHIYFLRNKPTTAHTPMHHANCLCTYIYPRDSAGNKCPVTHGRRPGPRGVCVTRTVDYNYIQERVIAQNAQAMPTKLHAPCHGLQI